MAEPTGVLLMAYGTPATLADVEAYYTHIRHGRPPEPALLVELVKRYEAIGGSSPLLEISRAQQHGLAAVLTAEGEDCRVELGMKHAYPFIEDGIEALIAAGLRRAVGVVLAPHYSALSVGEYIQRATSAADGRLELCFVEAWHSEPSYTALLADRVQHAIEQLAPALREGADVVFTAHSLPARILQTDDPYPQQLSQTADAVAERAGLARWSVAWQSAGRTAEPWLGPSLTDVMSELAASDSRAVVVCPAGFVADHLEVLYDLDVEARALAAQLGLGWARTQSPNADLAFLRTLAEVVSARLEVGAR